MQLLSKGSRWKWGLVEATLLLFTCLPFMAKGFVFPSTSHHHGDLFLKKKTMMMMARYDDDGSGGGGGGGDHHHRPEDDSSLDPIVAKNKARTDLRNLLTQRSIQSFVYLLNQVHDVHTRNWIEVSSTIQ